MDEQKRYKLVPKPNNTDDIIETVHWTVKQILDYINSDRSEEWQNYNETDWKEGLEYFGYPYVLEE